jgi:hypothetical protein
MNAIHNGLLGSCAVMLAIELAGATSGRFSNAEAIAAKHGVAQAYENHAEMAASEG